jgi:very-short-patch-repair endonuclease
MRIKKIISLSKTSNKEKSKTAVKQSKLHRYSKSLKKNRTKEELLFESLLKKVRVKFKAQKIIVPYEDNHGGYVLDFYIKHPYRLCIEIDGYYHNSRTEKDAYRDKWLLENRNIRTIRIKNDEVYNMTVSDIHSILNLLKK